RPAELHGRPGGVHHRPVPDPHGPAEGRPSGRTRRALRQGPEDRQPAQGARPCHRPVRQEPPGRPQRVHPTVHGFDEFFGNFYHLNAEEEPENPDYPKDPAFKQKFGPRGVFHCYATDTASTLPADPRFGAWGKQRCEDTGALTKKRMETIDDEVMAATLKFIDTSQAANKPWFVWFNTTRMHINTHLKPESAGK